MNSLETIIPAKKEIGQTSEPSGPDVLQMLADYIRTADLSAGDRLPSIRELAAHWTLRPHIVRDGVLHAQQLGLIEVRRQSGIFVNAPSVANSVQNLQNTLTIAAATTDEGLLELIESRRVVETELAGMAAQRVRVEALLPLRRALEHMEKNVKNRPEFIAGDEEFHRQIAQLAGNSVLCMVLNGFLEMLHPIKEQLNAGQKRCIHTQEEHRLIYQLISKGDADTAREAMRQHLTFEPDWIFSILDSRKEVTGGYSANSSKKT